jgi:hypothetical protein
MIIPANLCINMGSSVSDPDQVSGTGSGSRRAKMTNKNWKKLRNFMF